MEQGTVSLKPPQWFDLRKADLIGPKLEIVYKDVQEQVIKFWEKYKDEKVDDEELIIDNFQTIRKEPSPSIPSERGNVVHMEVMGKNGKPTQVCAKRYEFCVKGVDTEKGVRIRCNVRSNIFFDHQKLT